MSKPFYEEFANHAFRFYVRYPGIDRQNVTLPDYTTWEACRDAIGEFDERDRAILITVYRSSRPVPETVKTVAVDARCSENDIWKLLAKAARTFAVKRGIL